MDHQGTLKIILTLGCAGGDFKDHLSDRITWLFMKLVR